MNIINNLVLGKDGNEQKFVVLVLSNGETHFCTAPLYGGMGGEERHKNIVARFCEKKRFVPKYVSCGAIVTAINRRGKITLEVDGGGLIRTRSGSISSSNASSDYGEPSRSIVEYCIREAMQKEGLEGFNLSVYEVRED